MAAWQLWDIHLHAFHAPAAIKGLPGPATEAAELSGLTTPS